MLCPCMLYTVHRPDLTLPADPPTQLAINQSQADLHNDNGTRKPIGASITITMATMSSLRYELCWETQAHI